MILDSHGVPFSRESTTRPAAVRPTSWVGQWSRKGDVATRAHNAALSFTSAMSVQFWIRPFTADLVSFPVLLSKGNVNTSYVVLFDSSTGRVTFRVMIGAVQKNADDTATFNRNAWNSYMGTYDGSNVRLYRAGSSTPVATTAATGNIDTNSNTLYVGDGNTAQNNSYNGLLYDVRLFNTARSGAQYAGEYNSVINPATSGLVANWLFDEGTGTTVADETSNGLNLTLANADQWSSVVAKPY
jgi:hypothetical protein